MKIKNSLYFLLLFFVSCSVSENAELESTDINSESGIVCEVTPLTYINSGTTSRSTLDLGSTGMDFNWQKDDKITVFSDQENSGSFQLLSSDASKSTAKFTGGGFQLIDQKQYYTLSKSTQAADTLFVKGLDTSNYTNIKASYSGQRQTVNETTADRNNNVHTATAHLGKYDYMAAVATATGTNIAHFVFKHLGLTLRLIFTGLPNSVKYKKITMYDASEDEFRRIARSINITNGNSNGTYNPYWNSDDVLSERMSIDLGSESGEGIALNEKGNLIVYMEIPPMDFTGRTIAFRITPTSGKPYFATYTGENLEAGTAVQMVMSAQECTQYTLNVKIVKNWNKGNVVSRSTGDPGNTEEFAKPKYLYAFFVNNGKLVSTAYATDIAESTWTGDDGIYSYNGKWTNTADGTSTTESTSLSLDATNSTNPRVYIIASPSQISSWKDSSGNTVTLEYGTDSGTEESVIQSLSYNNKDVDIKNLYSTAYVDGSSFSGTLGDDVKDVRLYHVASKVDINWENNTSTALSGSVSLNNIPTTNLSFFKPTTNAAGTTVVSAPAITTGTAYTGRAVWYVPQVKGGTYNVTLGGKTQDITFTPDATYTSWFRGLITIK